MNVNVFGKPNKNPPPNQWPTYPWVDGWKVHGVIKLNDEDRMAIDWMISEYPGGPAGVSGFTNLMVDWMADAVSGSPAIPTNVGYWLLISSIHDRTLWKKFWKIRMRGLDLSVVEFDLPIKKLSQDRLLIDKAITTKQWIERIVDADFPFEPEFRRRAVQTCAWTGWRINFWQRWREMGEGCEWSIHPQFGIARLHTSMESKWVEDNLIESSQSMHAHV